MKDKIKSVAIYSRVSKDNQEVENQLIELREYCERIGFSVFKEYVDHVSGSTVSRDSFNELMKDALEKKFDTVIVWKIDRLGRSLSHLIETLDKLRELDIDFISTTQNLDTTTPTGKLLFHLLGAIAEFERELIRERVNLGLQRAKRNGIRLGRPEKMTEDMIKYMIKLREEDKLSMRKIASLTRFSVGTVHKILKEDSNS